MRLNFRGPESSEDESVVDSDEAAESEDYSEEEEDEEEGLSWDELEEEAKRYLDPPLSLCLTPSLSR